MTNQPAAQPAPRFGIISIIAIILISIIFGAGMVTYALALIAEAETGAAYYVKLGTFGAMLSIAATFFSVMFACLR